MSRLRYTQRAETDLDSIAAYTLKTWGIEQAYRYLDAVIACRESVAVKPELGRVHAPRPEYWRCETGKHVVFFRRDAGGDTLIVRILHERMLPDLHLRGTPEE